MAIAGTAAVSTCVLASYLRPEGRTPCFLKINKHDFSTFLWFVNIRQTWRKGFSNACVCVCVCVRSWINQSGLFPVFTFVSTRLNPTAPLADHSFVSREVYDVWWRHNSSVDLNSLLPVAAQYLLLTSTRTTPLSDGVPGRWWQESVTVVTSEFQAVKRLHVGNTCRERPGHRNAGSVCGMIWMYVTDAQQGVSLYLAVGMHCHRSNTTTVRCAFKCRYRHKCPFHTCQPGRRMQTTAGFIALIFMFPLNAQKQAVRLRQPALYHTIFEW